MGYWLGIGFGETKMLNSDIVLCLFKYTNNANVDKFLCQDSNATVKYSQPVLDSKDNIDNEVTVFSMGANKKANLEVTFERLLDTLDTANDYKMKKDQTIDAIWAHGFIISNTA